MLNSPFIAAHGVSVLELHRKLIDIMCPKGGAFEAMSTRTASPDMPPTEDTGTERPGSSRGYPRPNSSLVVAFAPKPAQIPPYPVYCQVSQGTQLERDARRSIVLSYLDKSLAIETSYARNVVEPRIKLDIRLARPFLNVRQWREWILRAPEGAQEVIVTGGVRT
jgi:hypothetical protein